MPPLRLRQHLRLNQPPDHVDQCSVAAAIAVAAAGANSGEGTTGAVSDELQGHATSGRLQCIRGV